MLHVLGACSLDQNIVQKPMLLLPAFNCFDLQSMQRFVEILLVWPWRYSCFFLTMLAGHSGFVLGGWAAAT